MTRVRTALATLALAVAVPVLTIAPSSAAPTADAPAAEAGPASVQDEWVFVAQHVYPGNLAIREDPGSPTRPPGAIVTGLGAGSPLSAACYTVGATISMWGQTTNYWVEVDYNGRWLWAWAGGLRIPHPLYRC